MELDALRLAFVLEAEARGLLPTSNALDFEAPGLEALQRRLVSGSPVLGVPGFAGTLLDPAVAGPFVPVAREILAATLRATQRWDLHAVGRWHEATLNTGPRRKAQGSFYTPRAIARSLVDEVLTESGERPTLLDPTMGCGAFLLEAFGALRERSPHANPSELALSTLYGIDQDPMALHLAVLGLWLAIADPTLEPGCLRANLRLGDSLLGEAWTETFAPLRQGGFDVVVGNPPFVNIERLDAPKRAAYRTASSRLQKRFDLYVAVADRALDWLKPGGKLGLVLPKAVLTQDYAERLRERLLTETRLLAIEPHPKVTDWGVPTLGLVAEKRPAAPTHRIRVRDRTLPQEVFQQLPGQCIRLELSAEALLRATRWLSEGVPLGRVAIATWGVRGVPINRFHLHKPEGPMDRPMLKGDCLQPARIAWQGQYLRYQPDQLYRPLFPELFERPKIVIAKVTGDRGLVAALDTDGYYTDDSLICIQPKYQLADLDPRVVKRHRLQLDPSDIELSRRFPVERLLELLQSEPIRWLFASVLGNGLNVYPEAVRRIPLTDPSEPPASSTQIRPTIQFAD